MEILIFNFLKY